MDAESDQPEEDFPDIQIDELLDEMEGMAIDDGPEDI